MQVYKNIRLLVSVIKQISRLALKIVVMARQEALMQE